MDDDQLDKIIRQFPHGINTQRLWRVKRSILTSLPPHLPIWLRPFQPRPTFLAATALFGLILGVSLPGILNFDAGTTADLVFPADTIGGFG
jgi:hypothetical protein